MASPAETEELKQVAVYSEPALLRQAPLQVPEVVAGEINNCAAAGTNQMMVVLGSTDCIAMANALAVQLTDEPQFGKNIKGAVNSYQPYIRVALTHLLMYGSWRKVALTGSDYLYHCLSLGGELIAMLPQGSDYFSLSKPHLNL